MRLLRAELRKLNRPLLWSVALASAVFCVLLAIGGANNAQQATKTRSDRPATCAEMGLPSGPVCTRAQVLERAKIAQGPAEALSSAAHVAAQLGPIAAGAEAAGLMASLPGGLMIALLAAWPLTIDGPDALIIDGARGREVSETLGRAGVWPHEIRVEHADLEDAFLHLTAGEQPGTVS